VNGGKSVLAGHTPQSGGDPSDLGFLVLIDTDCSRGGWLTALEVRSGDLIQANERGEVRTRKRTFGAKPSGPGDAE
jgi:serine/threonine protein phosphatase 1